MGNEAAQFERSNLLLENKNKVNNAWFVNSSCATWHKLQTAGNDKRI